MYRQVFEVPQSLHFEPPLDALSLRPDVIRPVKIISFFIGPEIRQERFPGPQSLNPKPKPLNPKPSSRPCSTGADSAQRLGKSARIYAGPLLAIWGRGDKWMPTKSLDVLSEHEDSAQQREKDLC